MLYTETVANDTLELLKKLMRDSKLSDFLLAGGTNLALRLGHRKSVDLDLFTYQHFDAISLAEYLTKNYNFEGTNIRERDSIQCYIDNIKVDIVAHIYPLVDDPYIVENTIRLYSIRDIVAMKLVAISDNGKRLKDFVDVAFLSTQMSLNQMLETYALKYNRLGSMHALRGLSYFGDIDFDTSIDLINGSFNWKKIEKRIRDMIRHENKVFETAP